MGNYRRIGLQNHRNTCHVCGATDTGEERSTIEIHHMAGKRGPEVIETLIPLCTGCHSKVHSAERYQKTLGVLQAEYRARTRHTGDESTGLRLSYIDEEWQTEDTSMKTLTLKIDEETRDTLDEEADANGFDSRSAYLRSLIEDRHQVEEVREEYEQRLEEVEEEYERRIGELEEELEGQRTEIARLQNEKRTILKQREENQELARYVERERTINEQWRQAGIITRTKWKLLGMPESEA